MECWFQRILILYIKEPILQIIRYDENEWPFDFIFMWLENGTHESNLKDASWLRLFALLEDLYLGHYMAEV